LVFAGPGVKHGIVNDSAVTTLDLPATFLDYGGVPRPSDMDSLSLRPVLKGEVEKNRAYISSGLNDWRLTFDGRYKLIRGFDPNPQRQNSAKKPRRGRELVNGYQPVADDPVLLFDLEIDPLENVNLAASLKPRP
jgi:arylsulfatase A-like enzyme